jgi:hypothetical protein
MGQVSKGKGSAAAGGDQLPDAVEHEGEPVLALGVREQLGGDHVFSVWQREQALEHCGDRRPEVRGRR